MLLPQKLLHGDDLVAWQKLTVYIVYAECRGDGLSRSLSVTREHDGTLNAQPVKVAHGLLCAVLYAVVDDDIAAVNAVCGNMDNRCVLGRGFGRDAVRGHQSRITDKHPPAADIGLNATPCKLTHIGDEPAVGQVLARFSE
ncbi:unknown [Firmicutes bacterium CAG:555]|nr:unknown [Firmicutes bacterium CAG:555]